MHKEHTLNQISHVPHKFTRDFNPMNGLELKSTSTPSKFKNMLTSNNIRGASLMAQTLKNLPAMWETWVSSPGQKDLLEKRIATDSNILAWRIPWTEEPGGIQFMGSQRDGHD